MRESAKGCLLLVACACLWTAGPSAAAEGWNAGAGVVGADLGLDQSRVGLALEVGRILPMPGSRFDFAFRGEYVQKAGKQPRVFVPDEGGAYVGDEEIVLHYLQPAVSLGCRWSELPVAPRLYAGGAMGLKVGESWTRPVEDGLEIIGFEDIDFSIHVGAMLTWRRWSLDLRWEQGLTSQLLIDEGFDPLAKAEDPLEGVDPAEGGAKIRCWRAGLVRAF